VSWDPCFACFCVVCVLCVVLLREDVRVLCLCVVVLAECSVCNVRSLSSLWVVCVLPRDLFCVCFPYVIVICVWLCLSCDVRVLVMFAK